MADVAARAGVSTGTVSRFLNGRGYVGEETRRRIQNAVDEYDYHPNLIARNLRTQRTNTVGVLLAGPMDHGSAAILSGLYEASHAAGYGLLSAQMPVESNEGDVIREIERALERFLAYRVDGIVTSVPYPGSDRLRRGPWDDGPLVAISARPWGTHATVAVDSTAAGHMGATFLAKLGHEKILHVRGPNGRYEAEAREAGYREAMLGAGLTPRVTAPSADWTSSAGYRLGREIETLDWTAVTCSNDAIAVGFMHAMRERGRFAPHDYSIVGVDDMPDVVHFDPPLTTVGMDTVHLGRTAFEMLLTHIDSKSVPRSRVLAPHLIERDSARPLN